MAAPGGNFYIEHALGIPAAHHESFEQLWRAKWQMPCKMGVYPFMFSAYEDFESIVERLISEGQKEPYDWDKYAEAFFPKAEELLAIAQKADNDNDQVRASEYYMRASAVYRIARFPAPRSDKQRFAWQEGKRAARRGLSLRQRPTQEVIVPHTHRLRNEGREIPIYYHLPPGTTRASPVPLIIIFTGLDGYRTELAVWIEGWSQLSVAVIVLEIPGTGDSPADPSDPQSPDRQWSSLFDWIERQPEINQKRKAVWGFSTGGYYAIRVAHTHAARLSGVVALGGGCHYMFDERWLSNVNHLEYPFDLATTLAHKFGYEDDLGSFKKEAKKFSLLNDGTLDKLDCARLLLVNGINDEVFPIDDYYLALQHGRPKEARFIRDRKHMGEPESFGIILTWLFGLLGLEGELLEFMRTIPSTYGRQLKANDVSSAAPAQDGMFTGRSSPKHRIGTDFLEDPADTQNHVTV